MLVPRTWLVLCVVLIVVGVAIGIAADGKGDVVGFAVGGAGAVLLVALGFYAVGRSEDRARERNPRG